MKNMMNLSARLGGVAAMLCTASFASAIDWSICAPPPPAPFLSDDYSRLQIGTPTYRAGLGLTGQADFSGCPPLGPEEAQGYLYFWTGSVGSAQFSGDEDSSIVMGSPWAGVNFAYATARVVTSDGTVTTERWASDSFSSVPFIGASNRYISASSTHEGVIYELRLECIAGLIRFEWTLTNTNDSQVSAGLRYGAWTAMLNDFGVSGYLNGRNYILLPTGRPIVSDQRYVRAQNPQAFPRFFDLYFRQSTPYPSVRVHTEPSAQRPDQTRVDFFELGRASDLVFGTLWSGTIVPDRPTIASTFAIFFEPQPIAAGGSRKIIYYMESPFMRNDANFSQGIYALATEPPATLNFDDTGTNDLNPNPFRIYAWVDNQYSRVGQQITLTNVSLTLTLPKGLAFDVNETPTKVIPSVPPNAVTPVSWRVVADGTTYGPLVYRVSCSPNPGGAKIVEAVINVAATPRVNLVRRNLVTFPWNFTNPTLTAVLGLNNPNDFRGFNWDINSQTYTSATDAQRGRGQWIITTTDQPGLVLNGASSFNDDVGGGFPYIVSKGWNLIGSPYLYPLQLNQMIATSTVNPGEVLTWADLVSRGWVKGALFKYDDSLANVENGGYVFSSDPNQYVEPGVGYWVFVNSEIPVQLFWTPIFMPNVPGSTRSSAEDWTADRKWRLQFVAKGQGQVDASNYLGVAPSMQEAEALSLPKPPDIPDSKMRLALYREGVSPSHYAQDVREARGRLTYQLQFVAFEAGTYSLTWPNISQVPKNVRFRMVDRQTGVTRDLRTSSSYTITMDRPGARLFDITVEPGATGRAVIGGVQVISEGRDRNAPVTIQYSLTASAQTTVRVLSPSGKEIYTAVRGRADSTGVNAVTWNKRDNAGRSVAPGNYIVEILVETSEGQRVRVTRPVVVVR